jgi:hypothetical protein
VSVALSITERVESKDASFSSDFGSCWNNWPLLVTLFNISSPAMATITNGASAKGKGPSIKKEATTVSAPSNAAASSVESEIVKLAGGKPDVNHHHSQLDLIKAEIDKTTSELVSCTRSCGRRRSRATNHQKSSLLSPGQCASSTFRFGTFQYT